MEEFYLNLPLERDCFKLPNKGEKYLLINNFLKEYFSDEDKAKVRYNLGITPLINELRNFILAKLFDEEGNVTFDLEPHENVYDKVLSSATIYNILLKYYTKEELDEWRESLVDEIHTRIQEIENRIHIDNELDENSEYPVLNKVLYEVINELRLLISEIPKTPEIPDSPEIIDINVDNKTIKKENGVLSTILRLHLLTQLEINNNSIDSAYELLNSNGERIGDRIIINKSIDYSLIIELLLLQIQLLLQQVLLSLNSQQKYIIISESEYEQLTEYIQDAIYLILEDEESVDHTDWRLGDDLPIILSEGWKFGDNLPIILSRELQIDPYNGHDYVEIDGIKWATMNIGANNITDFGLYFAWGETTGYNDTEIGNNDGLKKFVLSDYNYSDGSSMTKYNTTDNLVTLELTDDAAHINWGGNWKIPTDEEYTSLINSTTRTFTDDYNGTGVSGTIFTDKTDNTKQLFFPSAGICYNGEINVYDQFGNYWTNENDPNFPTYAIHLYLTKNSVDVSNANISAMGRYNGASIRAVCNI